MPFTLPVTPGSETSAREIEAFALACVIRHARSILKLGLKTAREKPADLVRVRLLAKSAVHKLKGILEDELAEPAEGQP